MRTAHPLWIFTNEQFSQLGHEWQEGRALLWWGPSESSMLSLTSHGSASWCTHELTWAQLLGPPLLASTGTRKTGEGLRRSSPAAEKCSWCSAIGAMQHLLPPLCWSWEVTGAREASPEERAPWLLSKGALPRASSELAGAQPAQEQQAGPIQQCPCPSLAMRGCEAWKDCRTLAFKTLSQLGTWL